MYSSRRTSMQASWISTYFLHSAEMLSVVRKHLWSACGPSIDSSPQIPWASSSSHGGAAKAPCARSRSTLCFNIFISLRHCGQKTNRINNFVWYEMKQSWNDEPMRNLIIANANAKYDTNYSYRFQKRQKWCNTKTMTNRMEWHLIFFCLQQHRIIIISMFFFRRPQKFWKSVPRRRAPTMDPSNN